MGPDVHAGWIEPDKEWLAVADGAVDEVRRGLEKLLVDRLHALLGKRPGVLTFLFAPGAEAWVVTRCVGGGRNAFEDAARAELRLEIRALWIVRILGLLLGVEVIEVAEEHVEAVHRRQEFVAIAEMVLAELSGRVTLRLEQVCNGRVFFRQPLLCPRQADFQQPGAQRGLSGDERGASRGAGLLTIIVREDRALVRNAVDVGER